MAYIIVYFAPQMTYKIICLRALFQSLKQYLPISKRELKQATKITVTHNFHL